MKKIVLAMAALMTICLSACSQSNKQKGNGYSALFTARPTVISATASVREASRSAARNSVMPGKGRLSYTPVG